DLGVDAVLFTCSAFGPAIDLVMADLAPLPVHKPNTAMVDEAVAHGRRIGLLASYAPTLQSMTAEFSSSVDVQTCLCSDALLALAANDPATHDAMVAEAARSCLADCDVIALAQFSLA